MGISKEEIEKFKKHMGLPQEFRIGDDVFYFKPLNAEDIPSLLSVIKTFTNKVKPGQEERWLEAMDNESTVELVRLIKKMVKISYPDIGDEEINSFVSANFISLSIALFQINDLGAKNVNLIQDKLAKLKARRAKK